MKIRNRVFVKDKLEEGVQLKLDQNLLTLYWGVFPIVVDRVQDVDDLFVIGEIEAKSILDDNPHIAILVAGTPIGIPGTTNMLRILSLN